MIGIYKITSPKGKVYIGQSRNIKKRISFYKRFNDRLKPQYRLYASFCRYGVKSHIFEIIQTCDIEDLLILERFWQDYYNVLGSKGLNLVLTPTPTQRILRDSNLQTRMNNNKRGIIPYNKGIKRPAELVKRINNAYSPLQRKSSNIIFDPEMGVYYYCLREASIAFSIPKQTLKMNLNAPNKDCRKNKTRLIIC